MRVYKRRELKNSRQHKSGVSRGIPLLAARSQVRGCHLLSELLVGANELIQRFPALATAAIALGTNLKIINWMNFPEGDPLGVA